MAKHSKKTNDDNMSASDMSAIMSFTDGLKTKLMIGSVACVIGLIVCVGFDVYMPMSSYAENLNDSKPVVSSRSFKPYDMIKKTVPAPNVGIMLTNDKNKAMSEEKAKQDELIKQQEKAAETARQEAYDKWHNPTGGAYPDVSNAVNNKTIGIDVDLTAQKVYIKDNGNVVYTMIASTGMDDSTPHGDYTIGMRGENFYNPNEQMGANYWTGFIGGTYLFHTVPTDVNGNYIESEALKLGVPASHGCVRLSISDAKWIYDTIPSGTPVHIA